MFEIDIPKIEIALKRENEPQRYSFELLQKLTENYFTAIQRNL